MRFALAAYRHAYSLSFEAIEEWFGSAQCPTKAHIRRALKKHLLQEQIIEEVKQGYQRVLGIFGRLQLHFPEAAPGAVGGWHHCDLCPKSFPRAQQLQIHKWSKHGVISAERQFVFGPVCESCGTNYWTTQRMQQHLRSTRHLPDGCFERLRKYRVPVSQPVRFNVPSALQHIQRLPAISAQPPAQFVGPTVFEEQQADELQQWHDEWKGMGMPETLPNELWNTFATALKEVTASWDARFDDETSLLQVWFLLYGGYRMTLDVLTSLRNGFLSNGCSETFRTLRRPGRILMPSWKQREKLTKRSPAPQSMRCWPNVTKSSARSHRG